MVRALLRRLLGEPARPVIMGSPAANAATRARLEAGGDDGTLTRHVTHAAFPNSETCASRYEVFQYLAEFDLVLSQADTQNGVIFEHDSEVASEAFDTFTSQIYDELDAMGWRYDGWGCPVVKG